MTHANAIGHIELPTNDLARSKTFYEGVFGWSVQVVEGGTYGIFTVSKGDREAVQARPKISDEYGFQGLFRDPSGNLLGVWSPA